METGISIRHFGVHWSPKSFRKSRHLLKWQTTAVDLWSWWKEARLCIVQEELTALEITNIIMRQERFNQI